MPDTLVTHVTISIYPSAVKPRVAGPFGCDKCFFCRERPAAGAAIYSNCYGDIICAPCAVKHEYKKEAAQ